MNHCHEERASDERSGDLEPYLRFERDPRWLARPPPLEALEQKLNQLKTHHSRMEQYLATPQAMRRWRRTGALTDLTRNFQPLLPSCC